MSNVGYVPDIRLSVRRETQASSSPSRAITGLAPNNEPITLGGTDLARRGTSERIASEFERQEQRWKDETLLTSSLSEKYLHESYARIIGMGPTVIPLILQSLQSETDDWFYALRALTGANPVPDELAGNMQAMADCWIAWGRRRGLISKGG